MDSTKNKHAMAHLVSQEELCDEFEMFGDQLDTPEVIEKCKRYSIYKKIGENLWVRHWRQDSNPELLRDSRPY